MDAEEDEMASTDRKSLFQFDVFPKIVQINKKSNITIKPLLKSKYNRKTKYTIQVMGMMNRDSAEYYVYSRDGSLEFQHDFIYEQEYAVKIFASDIIPDSYKKYSVVYLYCVDKDLYGLRPFKGDFHLHSQRSDGLESPAGVCAAARKTGLDFWAITDHFKYNPSLEAIDAFKNIKLGAKIFPGEEIHFHGLGHIIAFGGEEGLGEKYDNDGYKKEYEKELAETKESMKDKLPELPKQLAEDDYVKWMHAVNAAKKANAITVLAHPFWLMGETKYHYSHKIAEFLLNERCFDAFELFNGDYGDTNPLQVAMWQEHREKGNYVPIVSGTDAHTVIDDGFFSRIFTVVFSEDMDIGSIRQAIKDEKSVVVSTISQSEYIYKGGSHSAYGHFRLVAYTLYLMRQVFPLHDELCFEEGRLMARYIAGDDDAGDRLSAMCERTKKLYDKLWG